MQKKANACGERTNATKLRGAIERNKTQGGEAEEGVHRGLSLESTP